MVVVHSCLRGVFHQATTTSVSAVRFVVPFADEHASLSRIFASCSFKELSGVLY